MPSSILQTNEIQHTIPTHIFDPRCIIIPIQSHTHNLFPLWLRTLLVTYIKVTTPEYYYYQGTVRPLLTKYFHLSYNNIIYLNSILAVIYINKFQKLIKRPEISCSMNIYSILLAVVHIKLISILCKMAVFNLVIIT